MESFYVLYANGHRRRREPEMAHLAFVYFKRGHICQKPSALTHNRDDVNLFLDENPSLYNTLKDTTY